MTEATEATEHVHEWVEVVTEPTCTATGYTTYTCEMCGYSYQGNEVEAKGHQYTETVKEASCTEKGYTTHTCAVCGDTYDDAYTDALGHDFGDWITTKEATCDDNGEETRRCSRCDAYETNEVAKLGHDYGAVITAPNCTKAGFTTHTCSRCADAYVDSHTAALGHSWGKWTTVLAPTEEAAGSAERKCSACWLVFIALHCQAGQ